MSFTYPLSLVSFQKKRNLFYLLITYRPFAYKPLVLLLTLTGGNLHHLRACVIVVDHPLGCTLPKSLYD